jgi:type I site-specific deoxyribonuclease
MFKLSENIDPNKVFIVNRSELEGRIDPEMVLYSMKNVDNFKYPCFQLKKMLLKSPQYGANEASVIRINNEQPRYIRITDIDENGTLNKELGATAETIDSKYILNNNDILFARSGATVGKTYIHKVKKINYKAFFAGYMIRFIVNPNIIIPDFLFIYTQLSVYKKWGKATQRAAGQPNINAEEYKSLKIPLPPLEIQQQIVDLYEKAYTEKQQKEAEAQRLLDSIDDYLLGELGITLPKEEECLQQTTNKHNSYNLDNDNPLVKKGRLFLTNLSEVTGKRIDPKGYDIKTKLLKSSIDNIDLKKFIVQPLKSFIIQSIVGNWGIDENDENDENEEYQKCLVIRATEFDNQYNLNLDNSRVKYRLIKKSILSKIDLKENDLLIEKSGGSPDQPVGRIAIITQNIIKDNVLCYSNFIHKIRVDNKKINPEYLFCFLKMMHNIRLTEAMQSQTNGIRNLIMNSYLNQNIVIPVSENGKIDIQKQTEIANRITAIREKAKKLQLEAFDTLEIAKREIEQMILGN